MTRRFNLVRTRDVSGVSGTGIVADGVQFPNGSCVLSWRGDKAATNFYPDIETLIAIHGHEGATDAEWIDGTDAG